MKTLPSPKEIKENFPIEDNTVSVLRSEIIDILSGKDNRFIIITGPCSIDNKEAAIEYANKLSGLKKDVDDKILLIMRTYFEKPRTTIGWKGFIYDPDQDNSENIEKGLIESRKILLEINKLKLPTATELLNPIISKYLDDCISYAAIGARTTESQIHRELISSLNISTGFKNSTSGDIQVAIDSIISSNNPHTFVGISNDGKSSIIKSEGNPHTHLILRGGIKGPNYTSDSINNTIKLLSEKNIPPKLIVDCSHANSNKKFINQSKVALEVINQRKTNPNISGIMLESYLNEGKGESYGTSKTDECISWDATVELIKQIYDFL